MNREALFKLLKTNSPSGHESEAINVFNDYCSNFAKHEFVDEIGNSVFSIGKEDGIPFMISGHCDEISLRVQYIDSDGFIFFIKNGGIDEQTIVGSSVTILTKKGNVKGIIGKTSCLISKDAPSLLKIDGGFSSKEECKEAGVAIGDVVAIDGFLNIYNNNRFSYKGLDDKVGVFITQEVLRKLSSYQFKKLRVYGVATVQEEVGGVGATLVTKTIQPKYSIDYDVTFATDDGCVNPTEWGDIQLGKGGAISFSPDCSEKLTNKIIGISEEKQIPLQVFSRRNQMSNTFEIQVNALNCQTAFMAIPLRNMHTQVEMADLRDIQNIIDLTVETIKQIDNE